MPQSLKIIMKRISIIFYGLIICALSACSVSKNVAVFKDQAMLGWGTPEGISRLEESQYKVDFFRQANHFESQHNKLFCGPASAAIVLNSLRVRNGKVKLPEDETLLSQADLKYFAGRSWHPVFERYTQNNVFIKSPKSRALVLGEVLLDAQGKRVMDSKGKAKRDRGFQLHQLGALFKSHGLSATVGVMHQGLDVDAIKRDMISNLRTPDDYVIVNYKRAVLNQPGGGHISPIGAYHHASDSFLVMDVTPNKADWVWVSAALLFRAMSTFDTVENRGYLLLSEARE